MECPGSIPPDLLSRLSLWISDELSADPDSALGAMHGRAWAGRKLGREAAPRCVLELAGLLTWFAPQVIGLRWEAWPVILWEGGSIGWHDHHQAAWSAVVYVEAPLGAGRFGWVGGNHEPRTGDLLVFGGTERHMVEAGVGPRISVAINWYSEEVRS